ncbi:MAG: hypothetical protein V9G10_12595 [Candidatus Nanopelagicales bacterium]
MAQPTLNEMARRGTPYSGVLYVGLALTSKGPKVVEFNARFGDPETQAVLALLETPLGGLLAAAARGELAAHPPPAMARRFGHHRGARGAGLSAEAGHRRRDYRC